MKHILKLLRMILLMVAVLPLAACALSGGPINGQVLEEETGKPISDAIVVATWHGNDSSGLVHSQSVCYHVETTRTDANGKFHINAWSDGVSMSSLLINERYVITNAYKPGYTRSVQPVNEPIKKILLARFKGTKEEYFNNLLGFASCTSAGESRKNLYRLYSPIAEEAQALAETPDQKKRAERLLDLAVDLLVNRTKPTTTNQNGWTINIDPNDSYKKEDLLK